MFRTGQFGLSAVLPAGEVKLALVVSSAGMASLWAAGHPVEEWAAAAVVLYLTIRAAIAVVVGVVSMAARILAGYGKRVLRRHGIEPPGDAPADSVSLKIRVLLAALIIMAVALTSVGVGIFGSFLAMDWMGIPPLPTVFFRVAWGFWIPGTFLLALMFIAPALAFLAADARIRVRVSDARLAAALALLPEIQAGIPSARGK